ncbi:unnamed protein product, partial [Oppiella nova]
VKENIHAFKGDPKRITLFGEGAGSWSVAAHIISPLTKGLFNRAILSSGALLEFKNNGFLNKTEALKQSKEMAKQFGCQLKGMFAKNWMECLKDPKKINPNELSKYTSFFAYPVYGTEYLPYNAQTAFKKGKFRDDIELMAGVTTNEGPIITKFVYPVTNIQSIASKQDFQFTVNRMPFDGLKKDKIIDFYISRDKDPFATERFNTAFNEFYADFRTVCPTYLFAQLFAKYSSDGNVYFYQYTKRPVAQCESHMSRCHVSEDMSFVFGEPVLLTPPEAPKPSAVSTITTAIVAQQKARLAAQKVRLAAQKVQKAKLAKQQRAKAAARPVKVPVTTPVQQVVVAQPADTVLPAAGQEQPASPPADPNAAAPVGDSNPPPPQDPKAAPPAVAPADGQAPPPAPETSGQPVEVTTGAPIGGEVPPMAHKLKPLAAAKVIVPKPAHEANDTEDTDAVTDTATEDTVLKESAPLPAPDTTAVAAPVSTDPPSTPSPIEPVAGTVVAPVADTPVTEPPQPPPQEVAAPVAGVQAVPDAASAPPPSDAQPVSEPPAPVVGAGAAQPIPEPISTADWSEGATPDPMIEQPTDGNNTEVKVLTAADLLKMIIPEPPIETGSDSEFSKRVMTLWTNFAKTGMPTDKKKWPKLKNPVKGLFGKTSAKFYELNAAVSHHIVENAFEETCDTFWKDYYQ